MSNQRSKQVNFFFNLFFSEQIYTKVQSSTTTEINKYKKTHYKQNKKNVQRNKTNKQTKNMLPTHPVCFSQRIIKLLVKCYL